MIGRIVLALVVAVVVGLLCVLLGLVLPMLAVPPAVVIGGFFEHFAWAFGVLAGLWYFFAGGPTPWRLP